VQGGRPRTLQAAAAAAAAAVTASLLLYPSRRRCCCTLVFASAVLHGVVAGGSIFLFNGQASVRRSVFP